MEIMYMYMDAFVYAKYKILWYLNAHKNAERKITKLSTIIVYLCIKEIDPPEGISTLNIQMIF